MHKYLFCTRIESSILVRMPAISIKKLFVFIFLFAVLERTGGDLVSLIQWQFEKSISIFEVESAAKESEKNDDKSIKEFWICAVYQSLLKPAPRVNRSQKFIKSINTEHNFYPSVPTPPPNIITV